MSGGGRFQDKLIPMHAFGRHFKLGDLYDYRSDRIWTGIRNCVDEMQCYVGSLLAVPP